MSKFLVKKKWVGFICLCLLFASCSSPKIQDGNQIPISFLSCSDAPMVKVNIEGSDYLLMLDLGANVHLMLKDRVLEKLHHKEPVGISRAFDIQGNKYAQPEFKLESYQLGHLTVESPIVTEESLFFVTTGSRFISGWSDRRLRQKIKQIDGKVGSECFLSFGRPCFLDMSRSLLSVGETLSEIDEIYSLAGFFQNPLEIENGWLCVNIETNYGTKKFLIDTGAERSAIRKTPSDSKRVKLLLENFGSWSFYSIDFPDKIPFIDGILGMDFLKKHAVCFDFSNHTIYIK